MTTSYLSRLPRSFMRLVAGFSAQAGTYHLKRDLVRPPDSIVKLLKPWARHAKNAYDSGAISNPDRCGRNFVELLLKLRVVLLQDAAVLQPQFPDLCLWKHQIFAHPEWEGIYNY